MCFVWISEQATIIYIHVQHKLICSFFVTVTERVYYAKGTEF